MPAESTVYAVQTIFLLLLVVVVVFAAMARRLRVPYPMLLTSIEEEAKALQLYDNPSYCGQEKKTANVACCSKRWARMCAA